MIGESEDISSGWTLERILLLTLLTGASIGLLFMVFTMPW